MGYYNVALLAGTAAVSYFVPVVGVLVGIAGVAAYLTGSVRKSLAETQAKDIEALDHRIETLEYENKMLRESEARKAEALDLLIEQVKGTVELTAISEELVKIRQACTDRGARFDHIDHELDIIHRGVNRMNRTR